MFSRFLKSIGWCGLSYGFFGVLNLFHQCFTVFSKKTKSIDFCQNYLCEFHLSSAHLKEGDHEGCCNDGPGQTAAVRGRRFSLLGDRFALAVSVSVSGAWLAAHGGRTAVVELLTQLLVGGLLFQNGRRHHRRGERWFPCRRRWF